MTTTDPGLTILARRGRSGIDLLVDQLHGVEAWVLAHGSRALAEPGGSREARLDSTRRGDVVERQRRALVDRTARQLRDSDHAPYLVASTRAVLVHRNAWLRSKVSASLQAGGVTVVAALDNGADALGVVVAEQPDLLLVEDKLPMVSGLSLTREVVRYAPGTLVVAHVADDREAAPFLAAGATTALARRTPPAELAAALLATVAR